MVVEMGGLLAGELWFRKICGWKFGGFRVGLEFGLGLELVLRRAAPGRGAGGCGGVGKKTTTASQSRERTARARGRRPTFPKTATEPKQYSGLILPHFYSNSHGPVCLAEFFLSFSSLIKF